MNNKLLGKLGEDMAEKFLKQRGYTILHRNWRCVLGEIDIVAQEKDFLVFVEIKTRASIDFGAGYMAIDQRKQLKLTRLAQAFLKRYGLAEEPCRIDIVSINIDKNNRVTDLELIKDAFWER